MGNRIFAVAANTFRESIRNKILYAILAFALLVIGLTFFLADLSVGELARVIADLGLASVHVFGVVMAVFIGITLVSQEVERKTIYLILSKPVPRWEFIVGKALGLGMTLLLTTFFMAAVLFLVHAAYRFDGKPEPGILVAAAGIYLELALLVCVATFFSTFTTPVLSAIFTLSAFVIGHLTGSLVAIGDKAKVAAVRGAARGLFYVLPNLENFNWKNEVAYGAARPGALAAALGYFVCYAAAVLVAACLIFSRKDFK